MTARRSRSAVTAPDAMTQPACRRRQHARAQVRAKYAGLQCGIANEGAEWPDDTRTAPGASRRGRYIVVRGRPGAQRDAVAQAAALVGGRRPRPSQAAPAAPAAPITASRPASVHSDASGSSATIRSAPSSGPSTAPSSAERPRRPARAPPTRPPGRRPRRRRAIAAKPAALRRVDRPLVGHRRPHRSARARTRGARTSAGRRPSRAAGRRHLTRKVSMTSRSRSLVEVGLRRAHEEVVEHAVLGARVDVDRAHRRRRAAGHLVVARLGHAAPPSRPRPRRAPRGRSSSCRDGSAGRPGSAFDDQIRGSTAGLWPLETAACGASPPVPFGPCAPCTVPASTRDQPAGYANVNVGPSKARSRPARAARLVAATAAGEQRPRARPRSRALIAGTPPTGRSPAPARSPRRPSARRSSCRGRCRRPRRDERDLEPDALRDRASVS